MIRENVRVWQEAEFVIQGITESGGYYNGYLPNASVGTLDKDGNCPNCGALSIEKKST